MLTGGRQAVALAVTLLLIATLSGCIDPKHARETRLLDSLQLKPSSQVLRTEELGPSGVLRVYALDKPAAPQRVRDVLTVTPRMKINDYRYRYYGRLRVGSVKTRFEGKDCRVGVDLRLPSKRGHRHPRRTTQRVELVAGCERA